MILESFDALKQHLSTNTGEPKRVVVANPTDEHTVEAVLTTTINYYF